MGRRRSPTHVRPRAAPTDGTGGAPRRRGGIQRGGGSGPVGRRAGRIGTEGNGEGESMSAVIELTTGELRWRLAPEHRETLLNADGLRLEEWLRNGQARVVKHAGHRTVYQVRLPGLHFFLKHNRLADTRARLRE